jgi:ABC-type methionine transport system ATPase subunit
VSNVIDAEIIETQKPTSALAMRESSSLLEHLEQLGREVNLTTTVTNAVGQALNSIGNNMHVSATGAGAKATVDFSGMTINVTVNCR